MMTKHLATTLTASVLAIAAFAAAGTSAATPAQSPTAQKNIVQTAVAAGQFKTLVMLVKRAGLAGALTGQKADRLRTDGRRFQDGAQGNAE
jgi:uncharacterized surface protein with fasciclin (FAS1) repeats